MENRELEFSLIRHAPKLKSDEERKPLAQSGLSEDQQKIWKEAVTSLGIENDPEITYESLPLIQELAKNIFDEMPNQATLLITSNKIPRTLLTADFLSTELYRLAQKEEKSIKVGFIWEPEEISKEPHSLTNAGGGAPGLLNLVNSIAAKYDGSEEKIASYLGHQTGGRTHKKELDFLLEAVNLDLGSENSILKNRAKEILEQSDNFRKEFANHEESVYFFGIGHASSLLALDVAVNGKRHYDSVEQMPKPLALWKAKNAAAS